MYNLSIDTPTNRAIAEQMAANRIRSNMIFPTEPMHIQPHGIWSGGWHYTPYLLAGTNANYPPMHMAEAMRISSAGMRGGRYTSADALAHALSRDQYYDQGVGKGISGGRKPKKFLGMNTKQWKGIGKTAQSIGNIATPMLLAAAPEFAPAIIAGNAALQAAPTGNGRKRGRPRKLVGSGPSGGGISGGGFLDSVKKIGKKASSAASQAYAALPASMKKQIKDQVKQGTRQAAAHTTVAAAKLAREHLGPDAANLVVKAGVLGNKAVQDQIDQRLVGGKKRNIFKSIVDAGKKATKVATQVWNAPAFQPIKALGKEAAQDALKGAVAAIAPTVAAEAGPLGSLALDAGSKYASGKIAGAGRGRGGQKAAQVARLVGGASDGRSKRAAIVKKVMAEQGLKMIEASKYVKAHGLY
jgi:hypothetical protein